MSYNNYPLFNTKFEDYDEEKPDPEKEDLSIKYFSIEGESGFNVTSEVKNSIIHLKIQCTIYVYNHQVSKELFKDYFKYIQHNIMAIWDSDTGINEGISPKYHVDFSKVDIIETSTNEGILQENEVYFNVVKGNGRSRIIQYTDDRHGILYIDENLINKDRFLDYTLDSNTPAHEFGHMLGLIDRYAYLGYVNKLKDGERKVYVNKYYGITCPIFLSSKYDEEYSENYVWLHNLYTTQLPVGLSQNNNSLEYVQNKTPITKEKKYIALYLKKNGKPYETNTSNGIKSYSKFKIFITSKQLSIIKNKEKEEELDEISSVTSNIFLMKSSIFKNLSTSDKSMLSAKGESKESIIHGFTGSFIGVFNGDLVSDEGYRKSRGVLCGKPKEDNWSHDSNMEMRIRYLTKTEKDNSSPDIDNLSLRKKDLVCKFKLNSFEYVNDLANYFYLGDFNKDVFINRLKVIQLIYRIDFNYILLRKALINYFSHQESKYFKSDNEYKDYINKRLKKYSNKSKKEFTLNPNPKWIRLKSEYPSKLIDNLEIDFKDNSNRSWIIEPYSSKKIDNIICSNQRYHPEKIWDSIKTEKPRPKSKTTYEIDKLTNRAQLIFLTVLGHLNANVNHRHYFDNILIFNFFNDHKEQKKYRWFELTKINEHDKKGEELRLVIYNNTKTREEY